MQFAEIDVTGSSCLSTQECLIYVEGTSTALEATRVLEHLGICTGCRTAVAEAARQRFDETSAPPSTRTLSLGEKLLERYEIRRFIARGGMGEVYEAFDVVLSETVALKTLTLTSVDQPSAADRFLDEVRLARKVTHPNVCRILEFGTHHCAADGGLVPFLTMELLIGETLGRALAKRGPFEAAVTHGILRDIVAGLTAVHAEGIVHRDLKSENVFLASGPKGPPRAVVMDFGLAKAEQVGPGSIASLSRALVGTLDYISPEQIQGRAATPASDVYAFGVVAFEALTGSLPFVGDSPLERAASRLVTEVPKPSSVVADLSPAWNELVRRCLARDPSHRPASFAEVAQAIDQVDQRPLGVSKWAVVGVAALTGAAFVAGALALGVRRPVATVLPTSKASASTVAGDEARVRRVPLPLPWEGPLPTLGPPVRPAVRRKPAAVEPPPMPPTATPPRPAMPSAASDPFAPKAHPHHADDLINPYAP